MALSSAMMATDDAVGAASVHSTGRRRQIVPGTLMTQEYSYLQSAVQSVVFRWWIEQLSKQCCYRIGASFEWQ